MSENLNRSAARQLARLMTYPSERAALGAAARSVIGEKLDPARWAQIAKGWLGQS